jgi:hypothetical protein
MRYGSGPTQVAAILLCAICLSLIATGTAASISAFAGNLCLALTVVVFCLLASRMAANGSGLLSLATGIVIGVTIGTVWLPALTFIGWTVGIYGLLAIAIALSGALVGILRSIWSDPSMHAAELGGCAAGIVTALVVNHHA